MKTFLQLLIIGSLFISCGHRTPKHPTQEQTKSEKGVRVNRNNFPDINFRSVVCRLLPVAEGDFIPEKMLLQVKELCVSEMGIQDLKGIEYFTALEQLDCSKNQLTALDVSKNKALKILECGRNQLTEIDVTHNALLKELGCCHNQLKKIDVSQNPDLEVLICNENKISSIDVSQNHKLIELGVVDCKLKELDVASNKNLKKLYCSGNDLKELNLSNNTKMEDLYCEQPLYGHFDFVPPADNPNLKLEKRINSWPSDLHLSWNEEFNKNQLEDTFHDGFIIHDLSSKESKDTINYEELEVALSDMEAMLNDVKQIEIKNVSDMLLLNELEKKWEKQSKSEIPLNLGGNEIEDIKHSYRVRLLKWMIGLLSEMKRFDAKLKEMGEEVDGNVDEDLKEFQRQLWLETH